MMAWAGAMGCGGSGGANTPTVSGVTPATMSTIKNADIVTVTFAVSMDPTSLVLGGSMAAESDGGVWSTATLENDTLTISPATTWSAGTGTLTVAASDVDGNAFPAASVSKALESGALVYGVQTVYAAAGGTGDGTMTSPRGEINEAIAQAATNLGDGTWDTAARVDVAEGTYEVVSGTSHIQMAEGVSLFGGFSSGDWTLRDPALYPSVIVDTITTGGSETDPNRALDAGSGITSATVLDGVTVKGGGGTFASAVFAHDGATLRVQNNIIAGQAPVEISAAMYSLGASPMVIGNYIYGGDPTDASSYAVAVFDDSASTMTIANNTVNGGTGHTTIGIGIAGTDSVSNNTIDGGLGTKESVGIYIDGVDAFIDNNIVFTAISVDGTCIKEDGAADNPGGVRNNDLFGCPSGVYFDADSSTYIADVAGMEADLLAEAVDASGNVSVDPLFVDQAGGDWHFTAAVAGVTDGALDGSALGWGFANDKDGNPRTAPWSMGAYEFE